MRNIFPFLFVFVILVSLVLYASQPTDQAAAIAPNQPQATGPTPMLDPTASLTPTVTAAPSGVEPHYLPFVQK